MAVEVIRSKSRTRPGPRKVYEFGLAFYRGDDEEIHEFKAYPVLDAGSLNFTLSATRKPERAVEGMVRSIRKMLADDDGTPVSYRPTAWKDREPDDGDTEPEEFVHTRGDQEGEPTDPEDAATFDVEELEAEELYMGPDGEPHDAVFIREALKFENGSSRRRFAFLMDDDEDLTLEADQLEAAYKLLVGKAADRPTRR